MKFIFTIISTIILTISFAQQGLNFSYNLLKIGNIKKQQNLSLQNGILLTTNSAKASLLITKPINITQAEEENPFIALSLVNNFINIDENIFFYYKFKLDEQWSDWQILSLDAHTLRFEQIFLDISTNSIQFKIEAKPHSNIALKTLNYRLFYPGKTTANNLGASIAQNKNLNCNCPLPTIQYRNDWCSSGNCPKDATPTATSFTHLVVHHSAGSNTSSDWAATVRSIWDYHVNNRGWDDIGYNYIIDPNGVIYEGRGNDVQAAHFSCMNSGAMGVCLLGDFNTASPSTAMLNSLIQLMGWKECELNKSPLDTSYFANAGQDLINLCGHRDGNSIPASCTVTECPGNNVYDILGTIRQNIVNYAQNCSLTNNYSNIVIMNMDASPSPIYVNEAVQLNVDYRNIGDASINENLNISFRIDTNEVGVTNFSSLNINETKNAILTPYTFTTIGTHQYCVYIDAASNELLTNNNSYCVNLNVESRPTNINTIETANFTIYPNPTKNKLFVQGTDYTEISIYNPLGKLIINQKQAPISVAHLENGMYFIKIRNRSFEYNTSFIKLR